MWMLDWLPCHAAFSQHNHSLLPQHLLYKTVTSCTSTWSGQQWFKCLGLAVLCLVPVDNLHAYTATGSLLKLESPIQQRQA